VACTDCNRKKHGFDPGYGDNSLSPSHADRNELISRAVEHIKSKHAKELSDFDQMRAEIRAKSDQAVMEVD